MKRTKTLLTLIAFMTVIFSMAPRANAQMLCGAGFNYQIGAQTPNGYPVSFFDSSYAAGTITSWNWTSSNGQTSTLQNPVFNYTTSGAYMVCLTITSMYQNQPCTSNYCDTIYINTLPLCNANFTYFSNSAGTTFIAPTGNNVAWNWSFGDGTAGSGPNPTHVYTANGNYTVCLTVTTSSATTCTSCQTISVTLGTGCQAYYTYNQVPGTTTYDFTNQSLGGTYFIWNFADGTTSNLLNPSHTYNANGTYMVCLTVIDSLQGCSDTYCDSVVVGGSLLCDPSFTFQNSPSSTYFAALNQNNVSYIWDFGDSTSATGPTANHAYAPGIYVACLTVTNTFGTSCTSCQTVIINNGNNCSSNFAIYPDSVVAHTYYAYNLATGVGPISYTWSWGDGTSSNTAYPSHTYASAGLYTICLTITDALGCTSTTCYQFSLLRLSSTSSTVTINVLPGTTGVNEIKNLDAFAISPNPAHDLVNADFTLSKDTEVSWVITNMSGQVVLSSYSVKYNAGGHKIKLDVSKLNAGMYMMEINASGSKSHAKIIIQ